MTDCLLKKRFRAGEALIARFRVSPQQRRRAARACFSAWLGIALVAGGCTKRYTEIEVRDPGRVAVATLGPRGAEMVLPPDGISRAVALAPGVVAERRGHQVVIAWQDRAPLYLVDDLGVLPRTPPGPGIEFRGRTLVAEYNITPIQVLPQNKQPSGSFPIEVTTDVTNVLDARDVHEVRHWPGYVAVSAGIFFTVTGMALLASQESANKVGGGFLVAASLPFVVLGVLNLTSSTEVKQLEIPGAVPPR